jgi:DNA-directed RNA polymerase subunit M/transcription elongation factor TFIIS
MDRCPKCGEFLMAYSAQVGGALCMNTKCHYRERMPYTRYARKFQAPESFLVVPRNLRWKPAPDEEEEQQTAAL